MKCRKRKTIKGRLKIFCEKNERCEFAKRLRNYDVCFLMHTWKACPIYSIAQATPHHIVVCHCDYLFPMLPWWLPFWWDKTVICFLFLQFLIPFYFNNGGKYIFMRKSNARNTLAIFPTCFQREIPRHEVNLYDSPLSHIQVLWLNTWGVLSFTVLVFRMHYAGLLHSIVIKLHGVIPVMFRYL